MSFPRYPKYKASGVEWLGDVPAHWEVTRLKRACTASPSNIDKKTYDGEQTIRLCNYTDVYYNDFITADLDFMVATASQAQIEKFTLRAGDTIITKDSETADDIAVAAFVPKDLPGVVCGYHLSVIRPLNKASGAFVKWWFASRFAKSSFAVRANGLTRVGLGQHELENIGLALPPLPEQRAIAAFLDRETAKIDGLVAEQRRLIELLKEKRQAVISHAVTKGLDPKAPMKPSGVEWLGDVPAHWEVRRLKTLIRSIEQGWSPQCEGEPVESDQEWGVLKAGCANGGVFRPDENKRLPASLVPLPELGVRGDDLLVSRANTRELVGSAAVAPRDFPRLLICDKIYRLRFRPALAEPRFICRFLCSSTARSQIELGATGASASMLNIGQSVILELPSPVPSTTEQRQIVAALESRSAEFDTLVAEAESAITLLQERRSALISAAVTGQIDVRNVVATEAA